MLRQMIDETQQELQKLQQEGNQNNQVVYQLQQRNQELNRECSILEGRLAALQEVASKGATFPDGDTAAADLVSEETATDPKKEEEKESVN